MLKRIKVLEFAVIILLLPPIQRGKFLIEKEILRNYFEFKKKNRVEGMINNQIIFFPSIYSKNLILRLYFFLIWSFSQKFKWLLSLSWEQSIFVPFLINLICSCSIIILKWFMWKNYYSIIVLISRLYLLIMEIITKDLLV